MWQRHLRLKRFHAAMTDRLCCRPLFTTNPPSWKKPISWIPHLFKLHTPEESAVCFPDVYLSLCRPVVWECCPGLTQMYSLFKEFSIALALCLHFPPFTHTLPQRQMGVVEGTLINISNQVHKICSFHSLFHISLTCFASPYVVVNHGML